MLYLLQPAPCCLAMDWQAPIDLDRPQRDIGRVYLVAIDPRGVEQPAGYNPSSEAVVECRQTRIRSKHQPGLAPFDSNGHDVQSLAGRHSVGKPPVVRLPGRGEHAETRVGDRLECNRKAPRTDDDMTSGLPSGWPVSVRML